MPPRIARTAEQYIITEWGDSVLNPAYRPPRRPPLLGPQVVTPDNPAPRFSSERSNIYPEIHGWSYKPRPLFRGAGPLYFGVELEVSFDYEVPGARAATWFLRDLGYLKRDGSVEGFEIVTHPMSYPWMMREFPWEMLAELQRQGGHVITSTNGLHVHVSRAGFSGASHAYRWMKLLYRNHLQVERIGGRSSRWADFNRYTRHSQFYHLKNTVLREKGLLPDGEDEDREQQGMSHYAAINNMPRETYEVRVFAATLDPGEFKARVQLVAASIEYTRRMRAADITRDHAWDWDRFAAWVQEHRRAYSELAGVVTDDGTAARAATAEERRAERMRQAVERRRQSLQQHAERLRQEARRGQARQEQYNTRPTVTPEWTMPGL